MIFKIFFYAFSLLNLTYSRILYFYAIICYMTVAFYS